MIFVHAEIESHPKVFAMPQNKLAIPLLVLFTLCHFRIYLLSSYESKPIESVRFTLFTLVYTIHSLTELCITSFLCPHDITIPHGLGNARLRVAIWPGCPLIFSGLQSFQIGIGLGFSSVQSNSSSSARSVSYICLHLKMETVKSGGSVERAMRLSTIQRSYCV